MTTALRRVLEAIKAADGAVRFDQLSRKLDIEAGMLDGMLQHWVRKGRIREVIDTNAANCTHCGVKGHCPFVMKMPRRYELVPDDEERGGRHG
jgi:hypothetical protein